MGRRGPMPDPERVRSDHVALVPLNDAPPNSHPVPRGLLPVNKRRWATYFESDVAKALTQVDLAAVERLWRYYDLWERTLDDETDDDKRVRRLVNLEKPIAALEHQLGLTPMARARLGISAGKARLTLTELRRQLA